MRADKEPSSDLTGVGSEVAVQNVEGMIEVTVAVLVVGIRCSSVFRGTRVTAKLTAVWTNKKRGIIYILGAGGVQHWKAEQVTGTEAGGIRARG